MYQFTRAGLGTMVPVATRRNLGPYNAGPWKNKQSVRSSGLGWTGAFTVPGNETRFSMRSCSGSTANPMPSSSDLICGGAGETAYLNRIGCTTVGFQGSHHCNTDQGNQGLFFCCPPGVLDRELASRSSGLSSGIPSGALLGLGAVGVVGVALVLWDRMNRKREEEAGMDLYDYGYGR